MKYVLGFAFSKDRSKLVLIKKNRPKWQAGFLNGVGGKVEPEINIHENMSKEFKEETGVDTNVFDWQFFTTLKFKTGGKKSKIYCFRMFDDKVLEAITTESEEIFIVDVATVHTLKLIKNLHYLITMALDDTISIAKINYR